MSTRWMNLLLGTDADQTVVFSGGTCNVIDANGAKIRSIGRDELNDWLETMGLKFFDPQIHPDTHGRDYDYDVDGPAEQSARANAKVTLYEIATDTLGGVTIMEILRDAALDKPLVVWFSGADEAFDAKGRPSFMPHFTMPAKEDDGSNDWLLAHLGEYTKAGTSMRRNLKDFLKAAPNVTFVRTLEEAQAAIETLLQKI